MSGTRQKGGKGWTGYILWLACFLSSGISGSGQPLQAELGWCLLVQFMPAKQMQSTNHDRP